MRYMMFTVLLMWLLAAPTQARQPDDYWNSPRSTYEERRALFLDYYSENGSGHPLYGVFRQAARAASGRPLEMDKMREVISVIKSNRDCNDFTLKLSASHGISGQEAIFLSDRNKRKH